MPYHQDSLFLVPAGAKPLARDKQKIFWARAELWRRERKITALHQRVAEELLGLLRRFEGGLLYPSQDYLAKLAGCCPRTVGEALRRLNRLGLVSWTRRIIRKGSSVRQTSNAYTLAVGDAPKVARCAGRTCHGTPPFRIIDSLSKGVPMEERLAAQASLAAVAKEREALKAAEWAERARRWGFTT